jgi:hypothetical protein
MPALPSEMGICPTLSTPGKRPRKKCKRAALPLSYPRFFIGTEAFATPSCVPKIPVGTEFLNSLSTHSGFEWQHACISTAAALVIMPS